MKKRSVKISGHATSVSLEDEFWSALQEAAQQDDIALATLIARIDDARGSQNLSSALRVFVLHRLQERLRGG